MADRKNQKQKRQEATEAFWKNDIKKAEELSKRKFLPFEEVLKRAGLSDKVRVTSGARTKPMGSAGTKSNHLKRDEYGDSRAFDLVSLVPNKSVYDLLYENPMTRDYLSLRNARYIDERTPAALARTKGTGAHEHISLSDGIGLREGRAFIPAGVQSVRASFDAAMQTPQFDILQKVVTPDFINTLPSTLPTPSTPQALISEQQALMPSITLDEVEVIGNRPQAHPLDIITPRTLENIVEDRRETTPAVNTVAQVQNNLLDMRQKELEDNILYPSSSSYSFLDDEERQRRMQRDVEDLQFERQMNEALKPLLNKSAYGGKLFDGGGYISEEERARRKAAEEAFWQGDMENAKRLAVAPKPERMYEAAYEGPEISITPDIPYTELMKSAEKANLANRVAADLSTPTIGDQIEMGINQTIPFVGLVNGGLHQLRGGIEDLWGNTYEAERHRQLANRASDNSLIPTGTMLAAMTGNPWILGGVEGGFLGEALHDVDMNGLNNENTGSLAMASMAPFFHFQSETFPAMKTTLENKIAASPGMQVLKESPAAILDLVRPEGRAAFNIARDNMLNTQGVWDGSVDPSYFFHNKSMRYYTDHPYSGTRTADRDAKYLNAGKYKELVDDLRYFLSHDEGSLPGISVDTWGTKDRFTPKTIIEDIDLSNSGLLNSGTAQKLKLSDMTHVWRLDPQSGRYYRTYEEIPLNRRDAPKNTHSNMLRNLVDRDGNVDWDRFYSILNKDNVFIENTLVNKALKSENRVQELDKLLANDEITREEYQKLLARTAPENMSIEELMETQVNSSGNLKKHIEDVVKSAQAFPLPKGVSRKEFVTAALWHDVGKLIDYRNHGAVSADIMNRHLKEIASVYEFGEPQFNIKDIENAIRNHMSTETYYDRGLTKALQAVDVARGQSDAMEFGMQSPNIMGYDNGMHPTYTPMTPQEEIGTINKVFDKLGIDPIDSSMPQEAWEAEIADRLFKARTMVRGTSVPSLSDVYEYGPNKGKPVVKTVLELMSGKKDVDAYAWVKMSDAERQANGLPTLKEFNKKFAEYPITSQGHGRFNYEAGDRDLYRADRRVGNSEYFKAQKGPFDALYLSNSQDILSNYSHGGGEGAHLVSLPVVPRKQGESLRSWVQRNMIDTYNSNHDAVIHNPNDNPMMGVQQLFEIPHLLQTGEDLGIKIRQSASFPKVTETRHPRIVAAEEKLWPTIDTKSIAGVKYLKDKYGIEMPVMKLDGRDVSYGTNFLTEVFQAEQSAYRLLQDIELGSFMKNDAREYTAYGFEKLNSKRFPDMIEELESTDLHEVSKSLRRARKVADDIIEDAATIYTGGTPQVFPEKVRNIVEDLDHLFNVQLTKESWDAIVKNPTSTESREIATMLKNSLGQLKSLMNNPETWRNYYTEDVKKSIVKDRLERLAESVKDRVERKINNYKKLKETLPETIVDDSAQRNYLMDRFNYLKLMKEAGTMPRYMQDDFNTNRAYITRSGQLDMTRPFEFLKEKTGSQGYVVGPADGSRQILWETPYEGSFLIKTPTSKDALPIGQFFNFRSFGGNLNEEESFPLHNLFYDKDSSHNKFEEGGDADGGPTDDAPVYSPKAKAWYRDSFIGEDGKTYYTNPIKPGMVYNGYTWNTDGTKTRVASDEEKAYYSTIDPRKGYPKNIGEAFQWWRNVKRKENSEDPSKMDYTVGETLGEKVADAAWRKRLQLPYDKELLPVWNGDTIRLPKALEMEIPTDTNMLKERIAANEKYMKSPSYRALKNRFKDAKNVVESSYNADVNALEALRKTYSTGKPVGINEMAFNNRHFVNDNILADNLLSPLNVLQGYNIRYDKDSNKMYYSDEYDFDNDSFFGISPEWVVPGKPFRFRGSIDLEKKK